MIRKHRLIAAGVAMILIAATGVAAAISSQGDVCGKSAAQTTVFAELDLAKATDIWDHFPAFGGAPELSQISGPVHVVAFNGRHMGIPRAGRISKPEQSVGYDHVVCVVTASGDATYYVHASYEGFTP